MAFNKHQRVYWFLTACVRSPLCHASLVGAAAKGERFRRERAVHVSRLGQKLALDDREYEAALSEELGSCSGGDDSFEDVCDTRIVAWYEAALDFIDSEQSRQQTFLSKVLCVVNTTDPTSPRRAARRLLDAYEGLEAVSVAIMEGKAHYEAVMDCLLKGSAAVSRPGAEA